MCLKKANAGWYVGHYQTTMTKLLHKQLKAVYIHQNLPHEWFHWVLNSTLHQFTLINI